MLRSMYSAISGMKSQQTKLDVISNNIANVGTTAFKSSKVNFADTLYQSMSTASAPTATIGGLNAKSVGLGAKVSSINKLMTTGNALTTNRTLDVCVDGDGYFMVSKGSSTGTVSVKDNAIDTASTADNKMDEVYYTRDGNFSLDSDGFLLNSDGLRVMGYYANGADITADDTTGEATIGTTVDPDSDDKIDGGTALHPLAIPDKIGTDTISSFEIGSDGVITAKLASGGKSVIGQIAMVNFKNPEGLTNLGGNLVQESSNSGNAIVRSDADVLKGDDAYNAGSFGSLKSGYLEASNVDLTEQFTDMISATRSFQAASKMISNGDEILQTITGLIR